MEFAQLIPPLNSLCNPKELLGRSVENCFVNRSIVSISELLVVKE